MSRTAPLVAELLSLTAEIAGGAPETPVPEALVTELLTRARLVARQAGPQDGAELQKAVAALASAVTSRMEAIEAALREAGSRRHAISAYGALRTQHHSAQNIRTRV